MPRPVRNIARIDPGTLSDTQAGQIDAIFFAAAGRNYPPGTERDAFRERWLGRYLHGGTDALILALDDRDAVAGYLVGAVVDPSLQARFADIGYFRADFRELCRRYPAHLHINLAPEFRSTGIGARMIETFAAYAAGRGAPGMHVVTGKGMRNVRFYDRCGFTPQGSTLWNGKEVLFLGRALDPARRV